MDKISYKYLEKIGACEDSLKEYKSFLGSKEYTITELIKKAKKEKIEIKYDDVSWLIITEKPLQIKKTVEFYKSLNPSFYDISCLRINCKFCQTKEINKILFRRIKL